MTLKIARVDIIPVAFPEPPLRNSWGIHAPYAARTVLRLETDSGLVGYGETYGDREVIVALERLKEKALGEDPFNLERLSLLLGGGGPGAEPGATGSVAAFAAYETACLDIAGKAIGRPLSHLLGGQVRDRVEFSAYIFFHEEHPEYGRCMDIPSLIEQGKRFQREYGFRTFKIKGGVLPPGEEVELIAEFRRAFGRSVQLRLDPNGIWSTGTAMRVAKALEPYDLEYLEDPVSGIEGMAQVARVTATPLATNMCVVEFSHIPPAVKAGAVHVILSDHHFWGGLRASKHLAAICKTFRLGLSMHSNSHLDISMAAMAHLAASEPHYTYACDTHYPWAGASLLKGGKLRFVDGCLEVPSGPGLGIEVDEEKLGELHEAYKEHVRGSRDDARALKERDASWLPLKPRW